MIDENASKRAEEKVNATRNESMQDAKERLQTYKSEIEQLKGQSMEEGRGQETSNRIRELESKVGQIESSLQNATNGRQDEPSTLKENVNAGVRDLGENMSNVAKDFT